MDYARKLAIAAVLISAFTVVYLAGDGPSHSSTVYLAVPAVDEYGRGALADLTVKAVEGNGSFYINSQSASFEESAVESLNAAVTAAFARYDGEPKDLYYQIQAPASAVQGGSAGAAFAVGALLALNGLQAREGAIITGSVDADGAIGRVGSILPKAIAAKAAGYELLLVPTGESVVESSTQECVEKELDGEPYRECVAVTKNASIASETGIQVIEVATVDEAFELMWQ